MSEKEKIIIIEDQPLLNSMMKEILSKAASVPIVSSGSTTLA